MKPETMFQSGQVCHAPVESGALTDLRIECVTFDRQGLPRRRRLVSVLSMLRPPRPARVAERRAAILATFRG